MACRVAGLPRLLLWRCYLREVRYGQRHRPGADGLCTSRPAPGGGDTGGGPNQTCFAWKLHKTNAPGAIVKDNLFHPGRRAARCVSGPHLSAEWERDKAGVDSVSGTCPASFPQVGVAERHSILAAWCHPEGAHARNHHDHRSLRATEGSFPGRARPAIGSRSSPPVKEARSFGRRQTLRESSLRSGASLRKSALVDALATPSQAGAWGSQAPPRGAAQERFTRVSISVLPVRREGRDPEASRRMRPAACFQTPRRIPP
jgi:hypothetical protein